MNIQRVLVTGATGLVGRELCQELMACGVRVSILTRNLKVGALPFSARVFRWDEIDQAVLNQDAIIHLAGEPIAGKRWSRRQKARLHASRIGLLKDLYTSLVRGKVPLKALFSASAVGFYGDQKDELLSEDHPAGQGFIPDLVRDWELAAQSFERLGTRVVVMRLGLIFASQGGFLKQMVPLYQKGVGGRIGNGQFWMSWIHWNDVIRAFLWALESEKASGIYNLVAPKPERNRELSKGLADVLGVWESLPVPTTALHVVFGEMAGLLYASQRVEPKRLLEQGFQFQFSDCRLALDDICSSLKGRKQLLIVKQWVPVQREDLFPFFAEAKNLERITPPFLRFRILRQSSETLVKGTLIDYQLRLYGLPFKWRTEIENWTPPERFVDRQLKGPYKLWHHTHEFWPTTGNVGGTLIVDRVEYCLPMGWLGVLVGGARVRRDVEQIFSYRSETIEKMVKNGEFPKIKAD